VFKMKKILSSLAISSMLVGMLSSSVFAAPNPKMDNLTDAQLQAQSIFLNKLAIKPPKTGKIDCMHSIQR